jgi:hypothetical protein
VALRREQWNSLRVISVEAEPRGRKERLITDVISMALGREEMAVCL